MSAFKVRKALLAWPAFAADGGDGAGDGATPEYLHWTRERFSIIIS